jgi:cytochrome b561
MNAPSHFNPLLRIIHWLMVLMILAMLFIGVIMVSTVGPAYPALLQLHRPIGIAILVLAVLRLCLRWATTAPPLPDDLPPVQVFAAKASHVLLYAAMIGMPLIGWAMLSAGGYPVAVSKSIILPAIMPHDLRLYAVLRLAHTVIAIAFFALILAHLAAALMHGMIRRDGVLQAMTFGAARRPVPPLPDQESVAEPEPPVPAVDATRAE